MEALVLEQRTFGWTHNQKEAEKWVLENAADISEGGTFHWAVIEGFYPGLYIYNPTVQIFFEFVGDWETDGHYERIGEEWPPKLTAYFDKIRRVKTFASIG